MHSLMRRAVGRWRNSFGPWALLPGTSTPVITNWASGNIAPSMPMNGIVPPSPNARAGLPKEAFDAWKRLGESLGIVHVEASPLTRSSYHAKQAASGAVPVTLSVR